MAAVEIFTNNGTTTVTSGGTDAPVSGTSQTWTVTSSATFPAAATGSTQFHVGDPAQPSELIAVTNVTGTTWTVTRGAESTTPVAHAAGFTVDQVITAGGLNGLVSAAAATAYAVVTGGTATGAAFQQVASVGSSGQLLTSNGAGSLPSWTTTTALTNPMTTLGDMIDGGASGVAARLAGNTGSTKNFLTSTGSGGTANSPAWGTIASADVPTLNQNTTGTASNVTGTVATINGGTGLAAVTAYAVVTGGTAATTPLQTVSGLGTAGQALTSNGAGTLPTFQTTTPNTNWPTANGLIAWTYDIYPGGGANSTLIAGTVYLQMVQMHIAGTVGSAWVAPQAAGTTPTSGQSWLGLYSQGGTLIASGSTDSLVTSTAVLSVPLTVQGGQSLTLSPASYYVAILVNATSMPQYLRGTGVTNLANYNSSIRVGTGGTGRTTLAGTITPATTNSPITFWAGLS